MIDVDDRQHGVVPLGCEAQCAPLGQPRFMTRARRTMRTRLLPSQGASAPLREPPSHVLVQKVALVVVWVGERLFSTCRARRVHGRSRRWRASAGLDHRRPVAPAGLQHELEPTTAHGARVSLLKGAPYISYDEICEHTVEIKAATFMMSMPSSSVPCATM